MKNALLSLRLGNRSKFNRVVLEAVAKEILGEVKRREKSAGGGTWPMALGKGSGRLRRPLAGISRHIGFHYTSKGLNVVSGVGKRSVQGFLWAHHQAKGSRSINIYRKTGGRALYVPITKKAERLTAREAFRRSSRFGGDLKEGKIIGGELFYYDPSKPRGTKNRMRRGQPDFLWMFSVCLPKRALFDRRTIRTVVRRAIFKTFGAVSPRVKPKYDLNIP